MTAKQLRFGRAGLAALATSAAALCLTIPAHAQFEITGATGNTSESFDSLIISGTNQPWTNDTTTILGDSTLNGWSLFKSTNAPFTQFDSGTGSSNAGDIYSFGSSGNTERALGGLGSANATVFGDGSTSIPNGGIAAYIAFAAVNNSAATLTSFTLGFDGEQWRNGGAAAAQTMTLQYGFGTSFTDVTNWNTPGGNFDWASPVFGGAASGAAVNGNVEGLVAGRGGTVNGIDWLPGTTLWLRWLEVNDSGNDHGLAIDNFSLSWNGAIINPLYWDPNRAAAGVGGSGFWSATDPSNLNWNPAATGDGTPQLSDPDKRLIFGGAGGTIALDASGVTANLGMEVSAVYNFTGGILTLGSIPSINTSVDITIGSQLAGTNGLVKLGTGTLTLTNSTNSFSGDISINAGALLVNGDGQLGSGTKTISITGGLLSIGESFALGATRTLSGSGALLIPTGKTLTVEGTVNLPSVQISSGAIAHDSGGSLTLEGTSNTIGNLTLPDPVTITATNGVTLTGNVTMNTGISGAASIKAPVTIGSGLQRFTVLDTPALVDFTLEGAVSGTGRIYKVGDGAMRLVGVNSAFTGGIRFGTAGTTTEPGGRLIITDKTSLGTAQLDFNDGTLEAETNLTGANALPITVSVGAGQNLAATFAGMPMEFLGDLSLFNPAGTSFLHRIQLDTDVIFRSFVASQNPENAGGLLISGASDRTLTFTTPAATPSAESVDLDGPTLSINGSLTGTLINVHAGRLRGASTLTGSLTIGDDTGSDDALLEPGDGIGTLTTTFLNLKSDAVVHIQIDLTADIADKIVSDGFVDLGSGVARLVIDLVNPIRISSARDYVIVDNSFLGTTLGTFEDLPDGASFNAAGNVFTIDYNAGPDGTDVILHVIPEPTSVAFLGIGALAIGLRRRRATV